MNLLLDQILTPESQQGIRDFFLKGVYNDTYEIRTDGGPTCASETTFGFKYLTGLLLVPLHLVSIYIGTAYIARHHQKKLNYLIESKRGIYPSLLEYAQGILCFWMLGMQLWFKSHTKTMIFILNPCHAVTFVLGLCSLLPFNKFTDVLVTFSIGSCFGAWIGIAFAENGELSQLEIIMYYVQHVFACFLAPFILYLGGRYSASDQLRWPLPYYIFCTLVSLVSRSTCGTSSPPCLQ